MPAEALTLTVILPTRNEAAGVEASLLRLSRALTAARIDAEIVVVDDSDDATPEVLAATDISQPLRTIHRPHGLRHGGLAGAVLHGLEVANSRYVLVMDADLQHPPEKIADMLATANGGCDLVVASRYRRGGSARGLGSVHRRLVSRACATVARAMFRDRLRGLTDPLSGYFLFDRLAILPETLRPSGFKILLEIAVRGSWQAPGEIAYVFEPRRIGTSKATLGHGIAFLVQLVSLQADRLRGRLPDPRARGSVVASPGRSL